MLIQNHLAHIYELNEQSRIEEQKENEKKELESLRESHKRLERIRNSDQLEICHLRIFNQELVEALRANLIFHTPLALLNNNKPWDEYQMDAINRTKEALAKVGKEVA